MRAGSRVGCGVVEHVRTGTDQPTFWTTLPSMSDDLASRGRPSVPPRDWTQRVPRIVLVATAVLLLAHAGTAVFEIARASNAPHAGDVETALAFLRAREVAVVILAVPLLLIVLFLVERQSRRRAEVERSAGHDRHLASLGQMSATLAHEIRNPLGALKGHAELLVEMTDAGSKVHAKAERILNEARRLEQLTNDLLTFARTGRLRRDETDLAILVKQTIASMPDGIVADVREGVAVAHVDRVRILQLVENLFRNARQHGAIPIEVSLASDATHVELRVRDHGRGIPADKLEQIFEPFVTDATRGTGLGLAVVRRVATLHGGTAVASNHPQGGALFLVRLPR